MTTPNDDAEARFRAAVAEVRALREADEAHDAALPERTPADPMDETWEQTARRCIAQLIEEFEGCADPADKVDEAWSSLKGLLATPEASAIVELRALAASQRETITRREAEIQAAGFTPGTHPDVISRWESDRRAALSRAAPPHGEREPTPLSSNRATKLDIAERAEAVGEIRRATLDLRAACDKMTDEERIEEILDVCDRLHALAYSRLSPASAPPHGEREPERCANCWHLAGEHDKGFAGCWVDGCQCTALTLGFPARASAPSSPDGEAPDEGMDARVLRGLALLYRAKAHNAVGEHVVEALRIVDVVERAAARLSAGASPDQGVTKRKHLVHCPAHPLNATCICADATSVPPTDR